MAPRRLTKGSPREVSPVQARGPSWWACTADHDSIATGSEPGRQVEVVEPKQMTPGPQLLPIGGARGSGCAYRNGSGFDCLAPRADRTAFERRPLHQPRAPGRKPAVANGDRLWGKALLHTSIRCFGAYRHGRSATFRHHSVDEETDVHAGILGKLSEHDRSAEWNAEQMLRGACSDAVFDAS